MPIGSTFIRCIKCAHGHSPHLNPMDEEAAALLEQITLTRRFRSRQQQQH
jgi:hypothetical protein